MDLQQNQGSNVSGVGGNVPLSRHVVVVATSLVGCHNPRQSDLAELLLLLLLLVVAASSPIDQLSAWTWNLTCC